MSRDKENLLTNESVSCFGRDQAKAACPDFVSRFRCSVCSAPNTYRGSGASVMERALQSGLLCDLETHLYPHADRLKTIGSNPGSVQLVYGSGKGQKHVNFFNHCRYVVGARRWSNQCTRLPGCDPWSDRSSGRHAAGVFHRPRVGLIPVRRRLGVGLHRLRP